MHYQFALNNGLNLKSPIDAIADDFSSSEQFNESSIESLEDLLPKIHSKQSQVFLIEERITQYLKQLNLIFKTDPRQKEYEYYEKQQKTMPQFLGSVEGSPLIKQVKQKTKAFIQYKKN